MLIKSIKQSLILQQGQGVHLASELQDPLHVHTTHILYSSLSTFSSGIHDKSLRALAKFFLSLWDRVVRAGLQAC